MIAYYIRNMRTKEALHIENRISLKADTISNVTFYNSIEEAEANRHLLNNADELETAAAEIKNIKL